MLLILVSFSQFMNNNFISDNKAIVVLFKASRILSFITSLYENITGVIAEVSWAPALQFYR